MPLTGPQLRAQLADQARNPRRQVAGTGFVVTVKLRYANKNFIPEDLFDALETKYGSGKVTSDLDNTGRTSGFEFTVVP